MSYAGVDPTDYHLRYFGNGSALAWSWKPQYEQYFRFFSGIVLILLVVSPVLRVLHQDTAWHDTVEQYLFQMDVNDIQEQLAVTEGRRQEVIMQQYTEQLEEQIKKQAGQHALPAG